LTSVFALVTVRVINEMLDYNLSTVIICKLSFDVNSGACCTKVLKQWLPSPTGGCLNLQSYQTKKIIGWHSGS
jgi:hypothetical protein